ADAEQSVEAGRLADDPHPLVLHEALGDFADDEVRRVTGLECGGRLEQNPGKKQRDHRSSASGEGSPDRAPAQKSQQISPRPDVLATAAFLQVRHTKSTSGDRGGLYPAPPTLSRRRPFGIRALTATIGAPNERSLLA